MKIKWLNLLELVVCFSSIVLFVYYSVVYIFDSRYLIIAFIFLFATAVTSTDIYQKTKEI